MVPRMPTKTTSRPRKGIRIFVRCQVGHPRFGDPVSLGDHRGENPGVVGFEVLQKFSDKPLKKCEECGGAVEKKISSSSFHLKGSGWYKDNYSGSSSSTDTKKDKKNNPGCASCPNC